MGHHVSWVCCHTPVILPLGKYRQENQGFKGILNYLESLRPTFKASPEKIIPNIFLPYFLKAFSICAFQEGEEKACDWCSLSPGVPGKRACSLCDPVRPQSQGVQVGWHAHSMCGCCSVYLSTFSTHELDSGLRNLHLQAENNGVLSTYFPAIQIDQADSPESTPPPLIDSKPSEREAKRLEFVVLNKNYPFKNVFAAVPNDDGFIA